MYETGTASVMAAAKVAAKAAATPKALVSRGSSSPWDSELDGEEISDDRLEEDDDAILTGGLPLSAV